MADVSDFDYVLKDWAENVIRKIRSNMETLHINASGETSESLEYTMEGDRLQILGAPYFAERTEVGRTPTKNPQSFDFTSIIAKWIEDKGLKNEFGIDDDRDLRKVAGAIAHTISTRGSQKYREPDKQTDVYSSVLVEEIENLCGLFMTKSVEIIMGALDNLQRKNGQKITTKKL